MHRLDFKLRHIELKNKGWVSHSSNRILRIALSLLFTISPCCVTNLPLDSETQGTFPAIRVAIIIQLPLNSLNLFQWLIVKLLYFKMLVCAIPRL